MRTELMAVVFFDRINEIYSIENLRTTFLAHPAHPEILPENENLSLPFYLIMLTPYYESSPTFPQHLLRV